MAGNRKADAQRPEKKMFCIDEETDAELEEVCALMSMSRSDVVRQAIRNHFMYVCKDTYPDGLKVATIENREKLLAAQQETSEG